MLRFLLSVIVVCWAGAAIHQVCNSNTDLKAEQVVAQFASCADRDNNSVVHGNEIIVCISEILGKNTPLPESALLSLSYPSLLSLARMFDFTVEQDAFIRGWVANFNDSVDFTNATFNAFDSDHDGHWNVTELDSLIQGINFHSDGGDGILTKDEFSNYFLVEVYNESCALGTEIPAGTTQSTPLN